MTIKVKISNINKNQFHVIQEYSGEEEELKEARKILMQNYETPREGLEIVSLGKETVGDYKSTVYSLYIQTDQYYSSLMKFMRENNTNDNDLKEALKKTHNVIFLLRYELYRNIPKEIKLIMDDEHELKNSFFYVESDPNKPM